VTFRHSFAFNSELSIAVKVALLFCAIAYVFGSLVSAGPAESLLKNETWQHVGTEEANNRLHPKKGEAWSEGWIHFRQPIEIDANGIILHFSLQTDRTRGEDAGAVYAKFQFTKDPSRREQVSINATVRASDRWYMLYVDPGWQLPNRHYLMLLPPLGLFSTPDKTERFQEVLYREKDTIVATLSHWDSNRGQWLILATKENEMKVIAAIADDLEQQTSVKSLSFQFPDDFSVVSEITLERGKSPAESANK
jgi:hypothetical protein